jgi:DNA-binding HxlR family transcriptional regulator
MHDGERAALAAAVERVGDRWTLRLVHALLDGPRRFSELEHDLAPVTPNVLSQRLKALEADRLVVADLYQERPPRYAYELTAGGQELAGVLRLLAAWGSDDQAGPRHAACGTALEPRWWCRTCDLEVSAPDDEATWL